MNKEVRDRMEWLAYKCDDKTITPDVKDDIKYVLADYDCLYDAYCVRTNKFLDAIMDLRDEKAINRAKIKQLLEYIKDVGKYNPTLKTFQKSLGNSELQVILALFEEKWNND